MKPGLDRGDTRGSREHRAVDPHSGRRPPRPAPSGPPIDERASRSARRRREGGAYLEGAKLQDSSNCAEALPPLRDRAEVLSRAYRTSAPMIGQLPVCEPASSWRPPGDLRDTDAHGSLEKTLPRCSGKRRTRGRRSSHRSAAYPHTRIQVTPAVSSCSRASS